MCNQSLWLLKFPKPCGFLNPSPHIFISAGRPCQVSDRYHTVARMLEPIGSARYCPWIFAVRGPTRRSNLQVKADKLRFYHQIHLNQLTTPFLAHLVTFIGHHNVCQLTSALIGLDRFKILMQFK